MPAAVTRARLPENIYSTILQHVGIAGTHAALNLTAAAARLSFEGIGLTSGLAFRHKAGEGPRVAECRQRHTRRDGGGLGQRVRWWADKCCKNLELLRGLCKQVPLSVVYCIEHRCDHRKGNPDQGGKKTLESVHARPQPSIHSHSRCAATTAATTTTTTSSPLTPSGKCVRSRFHGRNGIDFPCRQSLLAQGDSLLPAGSSLQDNWRPPWSYPLPNPNQECLRNLRVSHRNARRFRASCSPHELDGHAQGIAPSFIYIYAQRDRPVSNSMTPSARLSRSHSWAGGLILCSKVAS